MTRISRELLLGGVCLLWLGPACSRVVVGRDVPDSSSFTVTHGETDVPEVSDITPSREDTGTEPNKGTEPDKGTESVSTPPSDSAKATQTDTGSSPHTDVDSGTSTGMSTGISPTESDDPTALPTETESQPAATSSAGDTSTALPYDPCAGKSCGDSYELCPPFDPDCFEIEALKACDKNGECNMDMADLGCEDIEGGTA